MLSHPGKTLSIYDLPSMCLKAWDRAANPVNIKSGFRCTGIVPFNRNIFGEEEFLCSAVTDRLMPKPINMPSTSLMATDDSTSSPEARNVVSENLNLPNARSLLAPVQQITEASTPNEIRSGSKQTKSEFISPELIQPYPKATDRKQNCNRGRKRGRCMIATDTPEKDSIVEKEKQKQDKLTTKNKKAAKRKILQDESSDVESNVEYADNSSADSFDLDEDEEEKSISKGDFIIANVYGKACVRKYVAIVDGIAEDEYQVRFLKKHSPSNRFTFTSEPAAIVASKDIVAVLPQPIEEKRQRFEGMVYFNVDFTTFGLV